MPKTNKKNRSIVLTFFTFTYIHLLLRIRLLSRNGYLTQSYIITLNHKILKRKKFRNHTKKYYPVIQVKENICLKA